MKLPLLLLLLLFTCSQLSLAAAKRFIVRPLNARQVYLLLYENGRTDAIPQGRIVTQGLTAIGNLASDITRRVIGGGSRSTSVTTQEICFESRQARSLRDAEAVLDAVVRADRRKVSTSSQTKQPLRVRSSEVGRILRLKRRKKLRDDGEYKGNKRIKNRDSEDTIVPTLGSRTSASSPVSDDADAFTSSSPTTSSLTRSPATSAAVASTGTTQTTNPTTSMGTDAGAGTTSTFTTETQPEGAINCIVIKKSE